MGKSKRSKTLVEKLLQKKRIPFQIHLYNSQERDAVKVASLLGVPAARLFKTLVVVRERGRPILAMVPSHLTVDLKQLAVAVGEKKVKMATQHEAEALTRLRAGGISPLALLNDKFDMVIDDSCQNEKSLFISAGQKGVNVEIGVDDFLALTGAKLARIIRQYA